MSRAYYLCFCQWLGCLSMVSQSHNLLCSLISWSIAVKFAQAIGWIPFSVHMRLRTLFSGWQLAWVSSKLVLLDSSMFIWGHGCSTFQDREYLASTVKTACGGESSSSTCLHAESPKVQGTEHIYEGFSCSVTEVGRPKLNMGSTFQLRSQGLKETVFVVVAVSFLAFKILLASSFSLILTVDAVLCWH